LNFNTENILVYGAKTSATVTEQREVENDRLGIRRKTPM
jgi:hypothetical protein